MIEQYLRRLKAQVEADVEAYLFLGPARDLRTYYSDIVSQWKGKPRFTIKRRKTDESIQVAVVAVGDGAQNWIYINYGTGKWGKRKQPYKIRPVRAPALAFRTGYNARTQPTARYDVGDGKATGDYRTAQEVTHPGIEPRRFIQEARANIRRTLPREINQVIRRSARRAAR